MMSLNIGGFNRRDNHEIVPTRTNNIITHENGSFKSTPIRSMPRTANIFSVKSKQQIDQERIQAEQLEHEKQQQQQRIIAEQHAQRVAQQSAQAPTYHGVPSIYNQTGKKS